MREVIVRVLGPVEIERSGTAVSSRSRGRRRILAALAANRGSVVTIDQLADIAGISPGAVRTSVSRLRSDLVDEAIVTRSTGYLLSSDFCDATIAEELFDRARDTSAKQRLDLLDEALQLWRGAAYADFADEPFVEAEAVRLDDLAVSIRNERAAALIELGRFDEATSALKAQVAASPLLDESRRLLMTSLALAGRTTEALREFQTYRRFLAEEVGTEPSAAAIDLEQRILAGQLESVPHQPLSSIGEASPRPDEPPAPSRRAILFTDVVSSTELWESHPSTMSDSLRLHDTVVRACVERHDGVVFSNPGDGFGVAFTRPESAVRSAVEAQEALAAVDWGSGPTLRSRMGIHVGQVEQRDGNFFGTPVNLAARLCDAGNGGQIIVSSDLSRETQHPTTTRGRYRLKGIHDPVELLQLGSDPFPPLRALDDRRTNLGTESSELIGREPERRTIAHLLEDSRLVTVTGLGGVGKTRLVRAIGSELLAEFDDGVWIVELARCRDLGSMLSVTAEALAVPVPASPERLAESLRGHDLLIILDNCEHMLDAVVDFTDAMLSGSSRLRLLATSRERLGIDREQVHRLDPISSSDDAVAIFRRRAAQVSVDLFDTDSDLLVEICDRLDRVPLAIELAAATCQLLSPQQLLDRMDQRFEVLRGSARRTARSRHESLRAAIDWSYDALNEEQKILFRRLSLFNGGADVDAVEQITRDLDTPGLFLLGDLVDRSLVTVIPGARNRYEQLETIRAYARQRSEELNELDDHIEQHVRWCEHHVRTVSQQAFGSEESVSIERLTKETSNIRAALRRLVSLGQWNRACELVLMLDDLVYASNPVAELVGPVVSAGVPEDHPARFRLLSMELVRRSVADGTAGRAELAAELASNITIEQPGASQLPVLLIASAFGVAADPDYLFALRERALGLSNDPRERARLLVAALLGTFYSDKLPKVAEHLDEAVEAANEAGMRRLLVPSATAACIGGLSTLSGSESIRIARQVVEHLKHLPLASIMSSGLITSYTELAVASDASPDDRARAVALLGPTLQGDFNRVGLAIARFLQHEGHHELAVRAVGACDRSGRSQFSNHQFEAILELGKDQLGFDRLQELLTEGSQSERSDIYRDLWSTLQSTLAVVPHTT